MERLQRDSSSRDARRISGSGSPIVVAFEWALAFSGMALFVGDQTVLRLAETRDQRSVARVESCSAGPKWRHERSLIRVPN